MITFGLDAEVFIVKYTDGKSVCIPAVDILKHPLVLPYGMVTIDGSAAEINPHPVDENNIKDLYTRSLTLHKDLYTYLFANFNGLSTYIVPAVGEDKYYKSSIKIEQSVNKFVPTYKPSFNAWTGTEEFNKFKESAEDCWKGTSLRSGGCHIHIGNTSQEHTELMKKNAKSIVKFLDYYVGLWSVLLTQNNQLEFVRRNYYGRAGSYRIPEHGLEYRVMSNTLIGHNPLLVEALARIKKLLSWYFRHDGAYIADFLTILEFNLSGDALQRTINYGYVEGLIKAIEINSICDNEFNR